MNIAFPTCLMLFVLTKNCIQTKKVKKIKRTHKSTKVTKVTSKSEKETKRAKSIPFHPRKEPKLSSPLFTFAQSTELTGENIIYGDSISINENGSMIAIGESRGGLDSTGRVNVYMVVSEANTLIPYGKPIYGIQHRGGGFGYNLALSPNGSMLAIAMQNVPRQDLGCCNYGRVIIYRYQENGSFENEWNEIGSSLDGNESGDFFGRLLSLSFDGNVLAVGGNKQVRVYQFNDFEYELFGDISSRIPIGSLSSRRFAFK